MKRGVWILAWMVMAGTAAAEGWSELEAKLLPDSSFALVETDAQGRKHRHCPFQDANGHVDADQLIWVLGRLDAEKWLSPQSAQRARQALDRHYKRLHAQLQKSDLPLQVDLNTAPASALVRLPGIGPVLAVRIIAYRNEQAAFLTPEDVMKVQGIDRSTFAAIRHYISAK
jgi:competence ComEA-like helix-hairpin-helix protein